MKSVTMWGVIALLGLMYVAAPALAQERAVAGQQAQGVQLLEVNMKTKPAVLQQPISQDDPYVGPPVSSSLSPEVRALPTMVPYRAGDPIKEARPRGKREGVVAQPAGPRNPDALLGTGLNSGVSRDPILNFEGIGFTGALPPDPVGAVGPNHYVEMVNTVFSIYDKSGILLQGPTDINQLWQGAGGTCAQQNAGDPIALYDQLADRFVLSQFTFSNDICIAVSQTGDPLGSFHRYEFTMPSFPDYFKLGVWPDAYYMGANESSYTAVAFDRVAMLDGNPAGFVRFAGQDNFLMPADHDGATPPPTGAPGLFYTFKDNSFHGGQDRVELYAFDVDFANPNSSTFTLLNSFTSIAPYNYTVCGFFVLNCVDQPNTNQGLDPVSEWPMFRMQYRNFTTHETLVLNFAIDVTGQNQAGIRWYELRNTGSGWDIEQEGTHAPDNVNRWMGSIAMDGDGNIALAYSVSDALSVFPGLRYATRAATDPAGTFQAEASIIEGGGSQTSFSARWGDYSALDVDPADDLTFWFVGEYQPTQASSNWRTRIATFQHGDNGGTPAEVAITLTPVGAPIEVPAGGGSFQYDVEVVNNGGTTETVDIWIDISGPGITRQLGPISRTCAPGVCLTRRLTQSVPAGAAAGTYTQSGSVGAFPTADVTDSFTWEKLASKGGDVVVADWASTFDELREADVTTLPQQVTLAQNYPNPFNPSTMIRYELAAATPVRLTVYNALGQQVATLADAFQEAGAYQVRFDASRLSAGIYLYVLEAGGAQTARQMILLK